MSNFKQKNMQWYSNATIWWVEKLPQVKKEQIFKYRTQMERFGENYLAGNTPAICPLCKLHYATLPKRCITKSKCVEPSVG